MKIALVLHDFDPRLGQGCYAVEVARRLEGRHEIHIVANTFGGLAEEGLRFRKISAWRGNTLLRILTFLRGAERLLDGERFDLIHAQGLSSWRADVITAHICHAARIEQAPAPDWKNRTFQGLIEPWERRFFQQKRARHLIAVSGRIAKEIGTHYQWSKPSTVIYHGIDTEKFRPPADVAERARARARYQLAEGGWVWLFVGEAVKGLREAIAELPGFPQARLLVISRSLMAPYQAQAQALGVTERIRFHGPEMEMPWAYRAADVLVYPSTYDAFAMVVAEAMATGLPVIAGKNIGAAEWIEPGRNGELCDPEQPGSLAECLRSIAADGARAAALGAAARETARKHGWDACADATEKAYGKCGTGSAERGRAEVGK